MATSDLLSGESSYSLAFSKSDFGLLKAIYLTQVMFSSYRHFCFGAVNSTFFFSASFSPSQNELIVTPNACILSSCFRGFHKLFPPPVQHLHFSACQFFVLQRPWPPVTSSGNLFMTTTPLFYIYLGTCTEMTQHNSIIFIYIITDILHFIDLQYVNFCCTAKWLRYRYRYRYRYRLAFPGGAVVKNLLSMQEEM